MSSPVYHAKTQKFLGSISTHALRGALAAIGYTVSDDPDIIKVSADDLSKKVEQIIRKYYISRDPAMKIVQEALSSLRDIPDEKISDRQGPDIIEICVDPL